MCQFTICLSIYLSSNLRVMQINYVIFFHESCFDILCIFIYIIWLCCSFIIYSYFFLWMLQNESNISSKLLSDGTNRKFRHYCMNSIADMHLEWTFLKGMAWFWYSASYSHSSYVFACKACITTKILWLLLFILYIYVMKLFSLL